MEKTLLVIAGPTAVGKTALAIEMAEHFRTEIISCDSRQFYKELNIGVARPTEKDLSRIKHHLIGYRSVCNPSNVSIYETEALACLETLFKQNDMVVAVGGSGLYIEALCKGIAELPDIDPQLRTDLQGQFEKEGIEGIRVLLKGLDPVYYSQVDLANPVRIMRALEVCITLGKPYSEVRLSAPKERPFRIIRIGLSLERELLYQRIDQRVDLMMKEGLLDEAQLLFPYKNEVVLKTVGYTELFTYFEGAWNLERAVEKIKTHSRRYAKRQFTWFNRYHDMVWFSPFHPEKIIRFINEQI